MEPNGGMREKILDVAQRLVETRGYDGFSYADVAEAVGIRKASIHHHFATKGDLAVALVDRFRSDCRAALAEIDRREARPDRRLDAYVRLFEATLADGRRMCLCGMLAAGQVTLPAAARGALAHALRDHEAWLTGVLRDGQTSGCFRADAAPKEQARALLRLAGGGHAPGPDPRGARVSVPVRHRDLPGRPPGRAPGRGLKFDAGDRMILPYRTSSTY